MGRGAILLQNLWFTSPTAHVCLRRLNLWGHMAAAGPGCGLGGGRGKGDFTNTQIWRKSKQLKQTHQVYF